jgi:hypothetical protein
MNQCEIAKRSKGRLNVTFNSIVFLFVLSVLFYLTQQCDPEPARRIPPSPSRMIG